MQTDKVDIWCLGILLFELLHKKTPFSELSMMRSINPENIIKFKPNIRENYKQIIIRCLKKNPE